MKLRKRLVASCAAMMMAISLMSIGASAGDSFSFYISYSGAVTSKVVNAGLAKHDYYVRMNYRIDSLSSSTSVGYSTRVAGISVASGTVSTTGNHYLIHTDGAHIRQGQRVYSTMTLNPSPAGIGSSATGYVDSIS